jgi:4-diphosphocytidyl-2-C-methyl-D-erythritol kinase
MHIFRSAEGLVAYAPAKLNLFFEVLARRTDGYHEIETLMCPIDMYDTLYFREEPSGQLELRCQSVLRRLSTGSRSNSAGAAPIDMPEGRDNLVFRAVELLRRRAGVTFGAQLRLVKRIPTAAGLGGGSSDAAAALAVANRGWRLDWPLEKLAEIGAEIGSDVPFFFAGGSAICRGRGEQIEPIAQAGPLHFVVVRPAGGLSTAAVYAACQAARRPQLVGDFARAYTRGEIKPIGRLLFNRLALAARKLSPWIERLQQEFAGLDCLGHGMTGSGTSYFGLCHHARHARRMARYLEAKGVGTVFTVRNCR